MKIDPKILFLIDGFGALASSVTIGVVLTKFQEYIGMPSNILCFLAVLAAILSAYSLSNFLFFSSSKPFRMKVIWVANLLYCLITGMFCLIYFPSLSKVGLTYFAVEIAIILSLVTIEKRAAERMSMSG
jgi:hypothetical protein